MGSVTRTLDDDDDDDVAGGGGAADDAMRIEDVGDGDCDDEITTVDDGTSEKKRSPSSCCDLHPICMYTGIVQQRTKTLWHRRYANYILEPNATV